VERLELAAGDRLRLVRADAPLDARDAGLGVAQAGYLLPYQVSSRAPFDENSSFREALLAPTPSELHFPLRVPPAARLHFSFAFHRFAAIGDRATFEVAVREAGESGAEALFRQELELSAANWHWHEARLDLDRFAGRKVDLTLGTRSPRPDPVPALWGAPRLDVRRRPGEPPNVLLVAVDTLRADHLSTYGSPVPTPHLDAFASEGVLFERAISPANWTLPAFVSIFTGLTPYRHGVLQALQAIDPRRLTLAERLRDRGWVTGAVLYKPALGRGRNLEQGFERYFNVPSIHHRAERNVRKAAEWLADNGDRRFFLFLHLNDPHQPFTQPPAFVGPRAAEGLRELGLKLPFQVETLLARCGKCATDGRPSDAFRELVAELYADEVRYVDDQFGALLQALAATGHAEDTLVIFLADHGEMLWDSWGAFNRFGHGGPSFQDLLTRVPLIVKPPRSVPFTPGRRVATPVSLVDVLPTVLDLVGIELGAPGIEGRSLRGLVQGSEADGDRGILSAGPFGESLRTRDWRYLRTIARGQTTAEYLFDLAADPRESRDASAASPGRLAALRAQLAEAVMSTRPGSVFVAVTAAGPPATLRVLVRGLADCAPPRLPGFGIPRRRCTAGKVLFEGRAADSLALLAELPGAEEGAVAVAEILVDGVPRPLSPGPPEPYAAGALGDWLEAERGVSVRLLRIPGEPEAVGAVEATRVDAGEIEALRALGYLDG
jgi:arylsulfatase A-like enzyme